MKDLSLYNISEEIYALQEMLEQDGGELTESHDELEARVLSLLTTKTDSCVEFVNSRDDLIKLAQERKKQLDEFIRTQRNTVDRFKQYVFDCMDRLGKTEIQGSIYHVKERKAAKVLSIVDEAKVPSQFIETEVITKIKTMDLKKAVKEKTISVEGISLIDGKRSIAFKLKSASKK